MPYFENYSKDNPVPSWLVEMARMLVEHKDQASEERGKFRESSSMNRRRHPVITLLPCRCVADNSWIRYEKAPVIPSNFTAIGDSVMVVNPTFGCVLASVTRAAIDVFSAKDVQKPVLAPLLSIVSCDLAT